ncbi:MAG: hypothetical protein NVS4B6_28240 [Mycobacterium sp.]
MRSWELANAHEGKGHWRRDGEKEAKRHGAEGYLNYAVRGGCLFDGHVETDIARNRSFQPFPPNASRIEWIGQPERGAFVHTPTTIGDIKLSISLAVNCITQREPRGGVA